MERAQLVNKRKHPRLRIAIPVQFKVFTKAKDYQEFNLARKKKFDARSENVSQRGISLVGKHALKQHDFLKLEFSLPATKRKLEAFASVAWCKELKGKPGEYEAGLYFLNIKHKDETLLGRFVLDKLKDMIFPLFHG